MLFLKFKQYRHLEPIFGKILFQECICKVDLTPFRNLWTFIMKISLESSLLSQDREYAMDILGKDWLIPLPQQLLLLRNFRMSILQAFLFSVSSWIFSIQIKEDSSLVFLKSINTSKTSSTPMPKCWILHNLSSIWMAKKEVGLAQKHSKGWITMNTSVTKHSLTMVSKVGTIGSSARSKRKLAHSTKMKIRSSTTHSLSPITIPLTKMFNGKINFG